MHMYFLSLKKSLEVSLPCIDEINRPMIYWAIQIRERKGEYIGLQFLLDYKAMSAETLGIYL